MSNFDLCHPLGLLSQKRGTFYDQCLYEAMDDLSVPHDRFHISHGYPFCVTLMKTSDKMYMLVLWPKSATLFQTFIIKFAPHFYNFILNFPISS